MTPPSHKFIPRIHKPNRRIRQRLAEFIARHFRFDGVADFAAGAEEGYCSAKSRSHQ